jgi:pyruvate,water dikinase
VKASILSRLLAAGFPIPDGIVLTTAAFAAHLREHGATLAEADRDVFAKPFPAHVADALSEALHSLANMPVAVRSSAVAEDLAGASFAGQYETVLNVEGEAAIFEAIRTCWASAYSGHIRRYRDARGMAPAGIAVLIQPMIPADCAGVVFTANPVTGDRAEAVVSAVRGLGCRLVDGTATPDEWLVHDAGAVALNVSEQAINEQEALSIAELARRVEAQFGAPQDIEWALSGGVLHILQARPITTLVAAEEPEPISTAPVVAPPGFWQRGDSHYPQPLYPFTRSVLLPAANSGFREMCAEFGLLWETVEEREIGGWVYLRGVPLDGGKDREPPPDWLMWTLARVVPSLRCRIRTCIEAAVSDKAGEWVERWHTELRPKLVERLTSFRRTDLRELSNEDLTERAQFLRALVADGQKIHMMLNTALNLLLAEFVKACEELLGWTEERSFEMVAGLSVTTSAPGRALAALAQRVAVSPVLMQLAETVDCGTASRMTAADPEFGDELERYKREFGCRTIRYELADPTLAELPELLVSLLNAQIRRRYDPEAQADALAARRRDLVEEARRILRGRSPEDRSRFERALARAERAYPLREEHGFYDTSMPLARLRYAALEIGSRLTQRRQIRRPSDVFLMDFDEALTAMRDNAPRLQLVARRLRERVWVSAHPGPKSYGLPPRGQPSFAALPRPARFIHEAVVWFSQRVFAAGANERLPSTPALLRGIAASPGTYTGPVRVIRDESQFSRIQAGDVLVCPITSPVWSVVFPCVGALVTDVGGVLSHSAIIAREYHIPSVVATQFATTALSDGQMVTVDGTAGSITALSR